MIGCNCSAGVRLHIASAALVEHEGFFFFPHFSRGSNGVSVSRNAHWNVDRSSCRPPGEHEERYHADCDANTVYLQS